MSENKRNIIVVACGSTGKNYPEDIRKRGYSPVIVDVSFVGTEESMKPFYAQMEADYAAMAKGAPVIRDYANYEELLARVKEYDPVLVVAGQEFGVPYATRLADDLGLPGTPAERIPQMTEKVWMHDALKKAGVRYIAGEVIRSVEDAKRFFDSMDTEDFVIKWSRACATQGLHICHGWEEIEKVVEDALSDPFLDEGEEVELLMQERIIGEEYIVNTVSRNGRHRVISMWHYDKVFRPDGSYVYNYLQTVNHLSVGHGRMARYAFDVLDAIGIVDGPVHGEYMIDEKGPVLIEVNCRPMGGSMRYDFLDGLYGHHETDEILDNYLFPEKWEEKVGKPYRPFRKGGMKIFIVPEEMEVETAPILQIAKRLRSYHSASFSWIGRVNILPRTTDLENGAGYVFLTHDDEKVVKDDMDLLHLLEMHYPKILYGDMRVPDAPEVKPCDISRVMEETSCQGSTLILSDREPEVQGAVVTDTKSLGTVATGFDQGILDLTKPESFVDLESTIERIFTFSDRIKEFGRVIIPESSYAHLPYGIDGMEILMRIAGLRLEMPLSGDGRVLVASVDRRG